MRTLAWTPAPPGHRHLPASLITLVVLVARPAHALPDRHDFAKGPVPVTKSGITTWASIYGAMYKAWPRRGRDGEPAPSLSAAVINSTLNFVNSRNVNDVSSSYAVGVASVSAVMLALGIITLVSFILFCIFRFCCNCCGRRRRTKQYSALVVWTMRVLMLVYVLVLCGVVLVGYTGVVGMTFTLDDTHDMLYADVTHMVDGAGHVINLGTDFILGFIPVLANISNMTLSLVPSVAALDRHIRCLHDVVSIGDNANLVRTDLRSLDQVIRSLPDMAGLNRTLGQLSDSVNILPDLSGLADRIAFLNGSIGAMPPLQPITDDLTSMNRTMQSLKGTVGPATTQIKGLRTTLAAFTTRPLTQKLAGFDAFWSNLPDLDQLKSDVNIADNAPFRDVNQTYLSLVQMQTAVNAIPSIPGFIADLHDLNTTKNQLATSLTLIDLIRGLNASLRSIPDLNGITHSMRRFRTFLLTDYHLDVVKSNVRAVNRSIAMQPSPLTLLKYMTEMKESVAHIKAVNFTGMIGSIQAFNRSLADINCVTALIDMVVTINTSLIVLPSSISAVTDIWDAIQPQIGNVSAEHASLESGVVSIKRVNSSLDSLPDFDDIIAKIRHMNSTSASLPDLSHVYSQISDLNQTLHNVPDMDTYINSTQTLNSSLQVANLDDIVMSLKSMNSQLHSMPPLQDHVDNMIKLNDTLTVLGPALTNAVTLLQPRPSHSPNGYSAIASGLVSGITQLQNTNRSRPDSSALINTMNDLNSTVMTMPDLGSTQDSLVNLNSSLSSFPDIVALKAKISSLQHSLDSQPDFNALNRQLRDLNHTVLALPNMASTQTQVLDVKSSADSANVNGTINELSQVADLHIDASATSQLDNIRDLSQNVDADVWSDQIKHFASDFSDDNFALVDYARTTALNNIDDGLAYVTPYESIGILGQTALLLIPVVVALLGLLSVVCRCGCGAMCMALIFIYMSFFYYMLAAVFAAPSVLISDFCTSFDDIVKASADISTVPMLRSNITALVPAITEHFQPKHQYILGDPLYVYVDYYLQCQPDTRIPLLIQLLPDVVMNTVHEQKNISDMVSEVETKNKVTLVPRVRRQIDDIQAYIDTFREVIVSAQDFVACDNVTPYLRATLDLICVDARNSLVVWSFSLFLLALLMTIGVCCGVLGFKRLQRQNRIQDQPGDDDNENDLEAAPRSPATMPPPGTSVSLAGTFNRTFPAPTASPNQK